MGAGPSTGGSRVLKPGDVVRLRGNRNLWVVVGCYQPGTCDYAETLIEPHGEAWNKARRLVRTGHLTLVVDLEDFD